MALARVKARREKQSDVAHADLRKNRSRWFLALAFTVLGAGAMVIAIVFGATGKVFNIPMGSILTFEVDPDTQLALLGFINKIMDLLVTTSLEQVAAMWITRSMISSDGVALADFELGEELTKPWKALSFFVQRWRVGGWRMASYRRFALAIFTSVCLTGLGVAINTVGMPKERWYPPIDTALPMTTFHSIDWSIFWNRGGATFGAGSHATEVQYTLLAANAFEALMSLPTGMTKQPYGWTDFTLSNPDIPPAAIALNTRLNGTTTQGYAWQGAVLMDIFNFMRAHEDSVARVAVGMTGIITIAAPTVTVTCGDFRADEFLTASNGEPWNGTVFTNSTLADQGQPALQVSLKPLPSSNFTGCTCDVSVGRILFPSEAWITNSDGVVGDVAFSPDGYGQSVNATAAPLPYEPVDTAMAQQLVMGLSIIFDRFNSFVAALTSDELLLTAARTLQGYRPDFATDQATIAPVLAHVANHMVAVAGWGYNHTENLTVDPSLSQINWQVYGSSPRLRWEWAASIILGVLVAALSGVAGFMLWLRISPGEWLKPAGVLVAANLSEKIDRLVQTVDKGEKDLGDVRFRLAKASHADVVSIVGDGPTWRKKPAIGRDYAWVDGY